MDRRWLVAIALGVGLCAWGLQRRGWLSPVGPTAVGALRAEHPLAHDPLRPSRKPTVAHRATVYLLLSIHCPISNSYVPTLNRLQMELASERIEFIGVVPGAGASAEEVESHQREYGIRFPVVWDRNHALCRKLGATHTPQAIVVSEDGTTLYSGRIDDRYSDLGQRRPTIQHTDLRDALESIAMGQEIVRTRTEPIGCVIESTDDGVSEQLTYCRDVAPILFEHCVRCHRPGEVAPFPLLTYEQARSHAEQIRVVTERRLMPPWKAEPGYGRFQNECRLSEAEIQTLATWVSAGAPRGDDRDLPPRPEFVNGWQLGEPDLVLVMSEPFEVPADGPDIYQHFVLPTGLTENRLIRAAEFRPGAPQVVHHALVFYDTTGQGRKLDEADPQPGYSSVGTPGFATGGGILGWGPGGQPRELPPGMGRPIEKDADIILQIHYHPCGKIVRDRSRLGLYFAPRSASWVVTEGMVANVDLEIPAGASRHRHRASFTLPVETMLLDTTPHMHGLGKEIRATAFPPNAEPIPLIWIKNWDFSWQAHYVFAEPITLPAGTRIDLECWFDNSEHNPLNPHQPPRTVRWGDFSTDEMAVCYFQMTTRAWDDFLTLTAANQRYFDRQWNWLRQRDKHRE
jgi:hypothetical protein